MDVRCHLEGSLTLALTSENACVLLPAIKTCVLCHRLLFLMVKTGNTDMPFKGSHDQPHVSTMD